MLSWLAQLGLVAVFCWVAAASPVAPANIHQLQLTSRNADLNNKWLMSDGHKLVPVGDDKASSFTKVCVHPSKKKGLSELHTYPVGIVDHALGLEGKPGVTTLVDITNPANPKTQDGQPLAWDSFRVADGKLTVDGEGHWDAFPGPKQGDWTIKWNDGTMMTTADNMPVQILLRPAKDNTQAAAGAVS